MHGYASPKVPEVTVEIRTLAIAVTMNIVIIGLIKIICL